MKCLRAQLAALSNDGSAISLNAASTPSDNSGSANRLVNDSRPLKGKFFVEEIPFFFCNFLVRVQKTLVRASAVIMYQLEFCLRVNFPTCSFIICLSRQTA